MRCTTCCAADEFGAAEAYRIGLVQEVVEPGEQIERAIALAREMLQCSPSALVHTIANARLALDHDEPTAVAAIPEMAATVQATDGLPGRHCIVPRTSHGAVHRTLTLAPRPQWKERQVDIDSRHVDEVLATTRAVRRRLDLERAVDNQLLLDCIDLAEQAPTGGNLGSRRWVIVRDQAVKDQLGDAVPGDRAGVHVRRRRAAARHRPPPGAGDGVGAVSGRAPRRGRPPSSSRPSSAATTAMAAPGCSTRSSRRPGASASRCGLAGWARPGSRRHCRTRPG